MQNRRTLLFSLAGAAAAGPFAYAAAAEMPSADVVPGVPPMLDFHDGLRIPMGRGAFKTLWEDTRFWLAYGVGNAPTPAAAKQAAVKNAIGVMKLSLITLAFSPERLEHVDGCGWRLRSDDPKDYVVGLLDLPGEPFEPLVDDGSKSGYANLNTLQANLSQSGQVGYGIGQSSPGMGGEGGTQYLGTGGALARVFAFTNYLVTKQDADLDYVRRNTLLA